MVPMSPGLTLANPVESIADGSLTFDIFHLLEDVLFFQKFDRFSLPGTFAIAEEIIRGTHVGLGDPLQRLPSQGKAPHCTHQTRSEHGEQQQGG